MALADLVVLAGSGNAMGCNLMPPMTAGRKIDQVAVAFGADGDNGALFARCDDGTVWINWIRNGQVSGMWSLVTPVPLDDSNAP